MAWRPTRWVALLLLLGAGCATHLERGIEAYDRDRDDSRAIVELSRAVKEEDPVRAHAWRALARLRRADLRGGFEDAAVVRSGDLVVARFLAEKISAGACSGLYGLEEREIDAIAGLVASLGGDGQRVRSWIAERRVRAGGRNPADLTLLDAETKNAIASELATRASRELDGRGSLDEAVELALSAVSVEPASRARIVKNVLDQVKLLRGDWLEGSRLVERFYGFVIAVDSSCAEAFAARAWNRLEGRDPEGARANVERALAIDGSQALALATRGSLTDDPDQAIADLNSAVALGSRERRLLLARATVLERLGELKRARADYSEARDFNSVQRCGLVIRFERRIAALLADEDPPPASFDAIAHELEDIEKQTFTLVPSRGPVVEKLTRDVRCHLVTSSMKLFSEAVDRGDLLAAARHLRRARRLASDELRLPLEIAATACARSLCGEARDLTDSEPYRALARLEVARELAPDSVDTAVALAVGHSVQVNQPIYVKELEATRDGDGIVVTIGFGSPKDTMVGPPGRARLFVDDKALGEVEIQADDYRVVRKVVAGEVDYGPVRVYTFPKMPYPGDKVSLELRFVSHSGTALHEERMVTVGPPPDPQGR